MFLSPSKIPLVKRDDIFVLEKIFNTEDISIFNNIHIRFILWILELWILERHRMVESLYRYLSYSIPAVL